MRMYAKSLLLDRVNLTMLMTLLHRHLSIQTIPGVKYQLNLVVTHSNALVTETHLDSHTLYPSFIMKSFR